MLVDRDRYARQRTITGWDQARVASARVLVVGAGALGNEVIKNLVLSGIGHLTLVDPDHVEWSNLSRSVLFTEEDVGRPKAQVAASAARRLNPNTNVSAIIGDLEFSLGWGLLRTFDLVLGCLDSVNARWALNRLCFRAGVPWINAGINPQAAEVALHAPRHGGCYECGMNESAWRRFHERYSCMRVLKQLPPRTLPTTTNVAALGGALQAHECIAFLHGGTAGGLRAGQKLFVSLQPPAMFTVDVIRDQDCPAHDAPSPHRRVHADVRTDTVDTILAKVPGMAAQAVIVLDHEIVSTITCSQCGASDVYRPVRQVSTALMLCPACGGKREPQVIDRIAAQSCGASVSLAQLGVAPSALVRVDTTGASSWMELTDERVYREV